MALLYPWATKEYLLWSMTFGQLVLYYRKGMEMKYGKPDETTQNGVKSVDDMTEAEALAKREELREQFGDVE